MSEVTIETKPVDLLKKAPLNLNGKSVVIDRNGVMQEYKLFKFLKGGAQGAEYPCPDVSEETKFEETVRWFGPKVVLNVLQNFAKAVHQKIRRDCTDEVNGIFDLEKALRKYASFDVAGMTLKAMSDKIDELQAENGKRIMSASEADYADENWRAETKRITKEILDLSAEYDEKKASGVKDVESQPSVVA